MFNVALYEPEIPPNTGNIIRLCANTSTQLHLIHPLGFEISDKQLKRAGLDYHGDMSLAEHNNFDDFVQSSDSKRIFALSTKGNKHYTDVSYQPGDILLFGPETRGLPDEILNSADVEAVLTIPMARQSRSLNLANAVAITVYEAWRQHQFA